MSSTQGAQPVSWQRLSQQAQSLNARCARTMHSPKKSRAEAVDDCVKDTYKLVEAFEIVSGNTFMIDDLILKLRESSKESTHLERIAVILDLVSRVQRIASDEDHQSSVN